MFKKMQNRKGFTLIEMLVVIAIIAVLVSIIIPVVGSSTAKAAAATNASNLRSVQGELATTYLAEPIKVGGHMYRAADEVLTLDDASTLVAPAAKECGAVADGTQMWAMVGSDGTVEAYYGVYGVDYFAYIAEYGKPMDDYVADSRAEMVDGLHNVSNFVKDTIKGNETLNLIANGILGFTDYKNVDGFIDAADKYATDIAGGADPESADAIMDIYKDLEAAVNNPGSGDSEDEGGSSSSGGSGGC